MFVIAGIFFISLFNGPRTIEVPSTFTRHLTIRLDSVLTHVTVFFNLFEYLVCQVYREGPSEIERVGLTFEELQKRIGAAERARDEASIFNDNLSATIKRLESK